VTLELTAVLLAALLGAGTGLIVPGAAYRWSVEHGTPARTSCPQCARPLPAGFGRLARRCPGCRRAFGPSPWWTVPAGAASMAAVTAASLTGPWVLPAALLLCGLGVLLAAIDIAVLRLPDPIMTVAAGSTLLLLALAALVTGDWAAYGRALLAGLALGASYLVLALLSRGQVGLGDVKLAGVLGLLLGWYGWNAALLGGLAAIGLNGLVALGLLLARRVGRRGDVPMGPSLLLGALLAVAVTQLALPTVV
jgi:leader peptidase (prepilin peptidase) / N-methyltransferase